MKENSEPQCPHCELPCKKTHYSNQMIALNNGYSATCGNQVCINKARSLKRIKRVGKKPTIPHYTSIRKIRNESLNCHSCGAPKMVGRQACDKCSSTSYRRTMRNGAAFENTLYHTSDLERNYKVELKKKAVIEFDEIVKQARSVLSNP